MSVTTRNKTNNTSSPSRKASAASTNATPVIFDELKQLIEEKFETIEHKITSVKKHMKDQHQELLHLIKETDKSATVALKFALSKTELITDNSKKTSNQDFQMEDMNNQIADLATNLNELKSELDDIKNRGLRKTLTFRNIPQTKNKESRDETKLTLAKEVKVTMPDVADDIISSMIERAHTACQKDTNQYSTPGPLPIIAKFIDWNLSEKVNINFIKAAKDPAASNPKDICLGNVLIIGNSSPKQGNDQTSRTEER